MKVSRLQGGNRIILGVSPIDSQMRQQEQIETIRKERDTLAKVMALNGDYLSLYSIQPDTGKYVQYTATEDYDTLGFAREGEDFFGESLVNIHTSICPEDLPMFLEHFSRDHILG